MGKKRRAAIPEGGPAIAILLRIIEQLRPAIALLALAEAIRALADLQRSNPHPLVLLLVLLLALASAQTRR
jgi:hypothetical protein